MARALISSSPVPAPMGDAPGPQSFMPLYPAGLCDAVNMAPGAPSIPEAKYTISVAHSPMSTTSTPAATTPSQKAPASSSPSGRMSRPTTTRAAPPLRVWTAKAPPMAKQAAASICSPTSPLMS